MNKPRDSYTLWLLDLFRETLIFDIEVSYAGIMSLTLFRKIDGRLVFGGGKNNDFLWKIQDF